MRVLLIGDGIALTTGFAQVLRQVATKLVDRHHDVHQLACLDIGPRLVSEAYRKIGVEPWFGCNPYDTIGRMALPRIYDQIKPDVVFINADAGTADIWRKVLDGIEGHAPVVLYAPVEGAPIAPHLARPFEWADAPYTYTAWSSERLKREYDLSVPYVYHGVDGNMFKPLDEGTRRKVRRVLGWEGKFVVMYVARNAGRKAHDRLIKAMALLRERGVEDILLYLHCKPYDDHQLQGWDLRHIAHYCGVSDVVQFPDQDNAAQGEPQIGLTQKYGAADLYIHPAKVEGFGLPILEAMSSGLPVVIPADGGNMQEVGGDGTLAVLHPVDRDTWFNGATLVHVSPQQIAEIVLYARENKKLCREAGERARKRASQFGWTPMRMTLADAIERVAEKAPVPV